MLVLLIFPLLEWPRAHICVCLKTYEEVKCTKMGTLFTVLAIFSETRCPALSCLVGLMHCLAVPRALKKTMKCLHMR